MINSKLDLSPRNCFKSALCIYNHLGLFVGLSSLYLIGQKRDMQQRTAGWTQYMGRLLYQLSYESPLLSLSFPGERRKMLFPFTGWPHELWEQQMCEGWHFGVHVEVRAATLAVWVVLLLHVSSEAAAASSRDSESRLILLRRNIMMSHLVQMDAEF